jgi:hypothetical protein
MEIAVMTDIEPVDLTRQQRLQAIGQGRLSPAFRVSER